MNTFLHSGDLGDIVASLPIVKTLGGGKYILTDHDQRKLPTMKPIGPRFHLVEGLIREQPYITSVEFLKNPPMVTHDFLDFRCRHHARQTLTASMAQWLNIKRVDMSPWLKVTPSRDTAGRIVVARSARYRNPSFNWRYLVSTFGKNMVFVGLDDEHADFCSRFGKVEHMPTKNLLEVAQAIAGSVLFIGNQSSPCWVSMGLGHPMIQETCVHSPDSIIPRPNAVFCKHGIPVHPVLSPIPS